MTKKKYRQLQPEERMRIEIWKAENIGVRDMAFRLGRSPSPISRELARNTCDERSYRAAVAQISRTRRRQASRPIAKLASDGVLWGVVRHFLEQKWSPQEISAILKRAYPTDSSLNVSHETIYNAHPRLPSRRAAPSTDSLPASGPRQASSTLARHRPTRPDSRHGQHPRAPARGQRPAHAGTLGRRPHQGRG